MTTHSQDVRPIPYGGGEWGADATRWRLGAERFRMITGQWHDDLDAALVTQHGAVGRSELGPGSIAMCLIRNVCEELSVLYVDPPTVTTTTDSDVSDLVGPYGYLEDAQTWNQGTYLQQVTLAEREGLKFLMWQDGQLVTETVEPHKVVCRPLPMRPTKLGMVRRCKWLWSHETTYQHQGDGVWVWEVWDIRTEPRYAIHVHEPTAMENLGTDITGQLVGFDAPEGYPWVWTQGDKAGEPFLPWTLYHAELATTLWDPTRWAELVDGTKDTGVLLTQFLHLMLRAAHTAKWSIGVRQVGSKASDGARRTEGGMTVLHEFLDIDDTGGSPGRLGEWKPAASPSEYMTAIQKFITLIASVAGIDASHIVRESADAWSGAALTVDREGKREAQKVYGARFRAADEEMVAKCAALVNINTDSALPESGYRVSYKALPLSPEEEEIRRVHAKEMVADGRWSEIDAHKYMRPGMTREEAILDMRRIVADAALVAAPAKTEEDDNV